MTTFLHPPRTVAELLNRPVRSSTIDDVPEGEDVLPELAQSIREWFSLAV